MRPSDVSASRRDHSLGVASLRESYQTDDGPLGSVMSAESTDVSLLGPQQSISAETVVEIDRSLASNLHRRRGRDWAERRVSNQRVKGLQRVAGGWRTTALFRPFPCLANGFKEKQNIVDFKMISLCFCKVMFR